MHTIFHWMKIHRTWSRKWQRVIDDSCHRVTSVELSGYPVPVFAEDFHWPYFIRILNVHHVFSLWVVIIMYQVSDLMQIIFQRGSIGSKPSRVVNIVPDTRQLFKNSTEVLIKDFEGYHLGIMREHPVSHFSLSFNPEILWRFMDNLIFINKTKT